MLRLWKVPQEGLWDGQVHPSEESCFARACDDTTLPCLHGDGTSLLFAFSAVHDMLHSTIAVQLAIFYRPP